MALKNLAYKHRSSDPFAQGDVFKIGSPVHFKVSRGDQLFKENDRPDCSKEGTIQRAAICSSLKNFSGEKMPNVSE